LKVDSRVIREEMKRVAVNRQQSLDVSRVRAAEEVTPGEKQLLELMLADSDVRRAMVAGLQPEDFADLATGALFMAIIKLAQEGAEPDFASLSELVESEEERDLLPTLMMSDLSWTGGDEFEILMKKATEALSSLRRRRFERRLETIQIEIAQAEREQNAERVWQLHQEKIEIKKRKLNLLNL
jgi:hypothetical protein